MKPLKKVEYKVLKLNDLKPAEYNPRIMSESQLDELEKSIEMGGMIEPIIVNKDMTVIGGHQRLRILKERFGAEEEMCVVVDYDKKTEKKVNLALNKISGFWSDDKLVEIIYEMKNEAIPGFEQAEIDQYITQKEMMLQREGSYDPDEDEDLKKLFERNEKIPVHLEEPEVAHKKDRLAFYTETYAEYESIRNMFKTKRKGELDKDKLIEILKNVE